jgi:hypothetical protein
MSRCCPLWPWVLIALVLAPSRDCDDRSSRRWLLVAAVLLLLLFAVLSDGTRAARLGNPGLWCRVPCTALDSPGTLVGQSKEHGDSFHVMCGQLLQHLFITYPWRKTVMMEASVIRGIVPRTLVKL